MQKRILGLWLAVVVLACTEPAPLEPLRSVEGLALPSMGVNGQGHIPFRFECTLSLTSFGSVTPQGSHNLIEDRVFQCDTTGDIVGHMTVTWDRAVVHNPGQPDVALNLLIRYDLRVVNAFGQAFGDAGFTGVAQVDIAEFRGDPTPINFHGDGELRGVALHGVDDDQGTGSGMDRFWAGRATGRVHSY